MRFRRRLALLGTVLAAGTITVFALLLVVLAQASGPADQDRTLDALAASAARDWRPGGGAPALVVDLGSSLEPAVVVADRTGTVVWSQATVDGADPQVALPLVDDALRRGEGVTGAHATVTLRGTEVRMAGVARADGHVTVAMQPTAFLRSEIRGLWTVVLVAAAFTALAGAVASWVVSGRALRPVRTLAAAVRDVARTGDLRRRLDVPRGRDEVAALATGFNAMMGRLEGSAASLESTVERQRRFVADASHELRTPLATIRSNAGFLAERPDADPADRAEALADLRAEADRMSRLVDDLLVLARTDSEPAPERRPVDLAEVSADVARLAGLRCTTGPEPALVLGDAVLLRRVVGCLVDNAVRHGAGDAPAEVDVRRSGGSGSARVVLTVSDRGSGFGPELVDRAFDRFARGDTARSGHGSGRGTGLGLAIVRAVTLAHGGTVLAADRPGGGATVQVDLPAA